MDSVKSGSKMKTCCSKFKSNLVENLLLISTVIAVILALGVGFILREFCREFNYNEIEYFKFLGEIFLRMLKFLILPLIGSSLISGIAGLGSGNGGKIAIRALIYYFLSTFVAVVIGIILVISIRPGVGKQGSEQQPETIQVIEKPVVDTILDLIRNLFPDNMVEMTFNQYETKLVPEYEYFLIDTNETIKNLPIGFINGTNGTAIKKLSFYKATAGSQRGLNVLGLIMFCFVFGGILAKMDKNAELLIKIIEIINEASVKMIQLVMIFSPIGIFSLILGTILEMKDPATVFESISLYMVTVIVGLIIHGVFLLPIVFFAITRRNIFIYTKNLLDPLLIALSTASSTAALPENMRCTIEKNKINKNIARFVLPVGATVNMNGTALYEAVAVIFIAQLNNRELSFVDLVIASVTATLASIGAASVPSAGLVTMIIILGALNLPTNDISLIYTIDWFLDRLRTTINVWGDAIGAGIVDHLSKKEIDRMNQKDKEGENATEENNEIADSFHL